MIESSNNINKFNPKINNPEKKIKTGINLALSSNSELFNFSEK